MLRGFRDFVFRGNLLDLAIAFVLGIAFAAVVTSFVDDILMNVVAAIFGKPDFSDLTFSIGDGTIRYGAFLTALIVFLVIAFILYLIYQAAEKVFPRQASTKDCGHCLSRIPVGASTCAFCTKEVGATV